MPVPVRTLKVVPMGCRRSGLRDPGQPCPKRECQTSTDVPWSASRSACCRDTAATRLLAGGSSTPAVDMVTALTGTVTAPTVRKATAGPPARGDGQIAVGDVTRAARIAVGTCPVEPCLRTAGAAGRGGDHEQEGGARDEPQPGRVAERRPPGDEARGRACQRQAINRGQLRPLQEAVDGGEQPRL